MCGINGIFNLNGSPVVKDILLRMNAKMIHRGPDDEGYYIYKNIGLSVRRLSIIDIQGGHQPISNEDGRYWMVFNGEIYNYVELRLELENKGHVFKTRTDTEVVIHLYEDMREGCLDKLNGMFTFAIWDSYKRGLFVANDRLGIKPLYYLKNNSSFCFSSELKSLLVLSSDNNIDYSSYILYLALLYVPYPKSMIKNILKLEPATYLNINDKGGLVKKSYWGINKLKTLEKIDDNECKETFLSILSDAMKIQLRSDVPVGTFLSGGIDSSCVVAMLSRMRNKNAIKTFSVGYEGHSIDERPYALQVSQRYGTEHEELLLTKEDIMNNLERIVWFMDEPIGDTAAIPTFLLSEMARQSGVKVILNGTGGDEVWGGYSRYINSGLKGFLKRRVHPMKNTMVSLLMKPRYVSTAMKLGDEMISYLCRMNRGLVGLRPFLKDEVWFDVLLEGIDDNMKNHFSSFKHLNDTDRFIGLDLKTYLVNDLLFLLDKMTMAASIEGRVPLIDYRMVEFMFAIPARRKIKNGNVKGLVKEWLKDILPDEVLQRKKMGFGGPVHYWLSNGVIDGFGLFKEDVSPVTNEIFKLTKIQRIIKNKQFTKWNSQFIYNLAIFELWYRGVFKGDRCG
jgi:asparagine synthase (glutamine-hydrolysing)